MRNTKIFGWPLVAIVALTISLMGCDGIELDGLDPNNSVPAGGAINNLQSARAAVNGLYSEMQMTSEDLPGEPHFDAYLGMPQVYSDEAGYTGSDATRAEFGTLNLSPANRINAAIFTKFYAIINVANNLLELLPQVDDPELTTELLNNFLGEARFARALSYFFLTNYYGDVPLVTMPTREVGDVLNVPNSTQNEIYNQIITDLQFSESNITQTNTRRATATAASALLARVYLFRQDWSNALAHAEKVIGGGFDLSDFDYLLDEIFYLGFTTSDGNILNFFYGPSELGGGSNIRPSDKLLKSFEEGDQRLQSSIDSSLEIATVPYVLKYNDFAAGVSGAGTDPIMLFRHAEQLLIAAEAAAETGDFNKANLYFNQVRSRAGLPEMVLGPENFVDLILKERFVELCFEGPHRWFDLRRRGRAIQEISSYQSCHNFWPMPQQEIDRNPNLVQNNCCNC